ncbi:MAG: DUF167 domain-containing protein [Syntrophobacteraceae bacterium]
MNESNGPLSEVSGGVCLNITVQPRASKSGLVGIQQGRLKIRIAAPPVDGEANEELIRFLARLFALPKSAVSILQGQRGKQKRVQLAEVSLASVRVKLLELGIDC